MSQWLEPSAAFLGHLNGAQPLPVFGHPRDRPVGDRIGRLLPRPTVALVGRIPSQLLLRLSEFFGLGRAVADPTSRRGCPGKTHDSWARQWRALDADIANGLADLVVFFLADADGQVAPKRVKGLACRVAPPMADDDLEWTLAPEVVTQAEKEDLGRRAEYWISTYNDEDSIATQAFLATFKHIASHIISLHGLWILWMDTESSSLIEGQHWDKKVSRWRIWCSHNRVVGFEDLSQNCGLDPGVSSAPVPLGYARPQVSSGQAPGSQFPVS